MKTRWLVVAAASALLAMPSSSAVAQDRGRGNDQNRGQAKKAARQFAERDREAARQWYRQNRNRRPRGFRDDDRLPPQFETRLVPGYVFDVEMRRRSYPVPPGLARGFGPPPRGYRYLVIGGHVVLVDDGYRVHDVIRLEFILGR